MMVEYGSQSRAPGTITATMDNSMEDISLASSPRVGLVHGNMDRTLFVHVCIHFLR